MERALKKAKQINVQLTTPKIGEPLVLGETLPVSHWWK